MKNLLLLLLLSGGVLAGCKSYPMGLSEAQWQALSPAEQADYQRQQTQLNEQRRAQREAEEEARRAKEAEAAELLKWRTREAYARARYGEVVQVTIAGGYVAIQGKHQPYEPVRFDLVRGERKEVEFVQLGRSSNRNTVTVRLSEDGNTFYFDEAARDRVSLISTGWEAGRTYPGLNVQDRSSQSEARAIAITLKFKELPGGPRRLQVPEPPKR